MWNNSKLQEGAEDIVGKLANEREVKRESALPREHSRKHSYRGERETRNTDGHRGDVGNQTKKGGNGKVHDVGKTKDLKNWLRTGIAMRSGRTCISLEKAVE